VVFGVHYGDRTSDQCQGIGRASGRVSLEQGKGAGEKNLTQDPFPRDGAVKEKRGSGEVKKTGEVKDVADAEGLSELTSDGSKEVIFDRPILLIDVDL
jgi:hypothetical protein